VRTRSKTTDASVVITVIIIIIKNLTIGNSLSVRIHYERVILLCIKFGDLLDAARVQVQGVIAGSCDVDP